MDTTRGQHKLALPLTDAFLKTNFLTYKKNKVEHKVHEELNITQHQLAAFLSLLDIDVNAPSYDAQQSNLFDLLIQEIPECSAFDAKVFYYPSAINVVQGLAIQADKEKRKINKKKFLLEINRKEVVFNVWLQQMLGADYYARLIRRKYFQFRTTKIPKAARFFVIDMVGEYDVNKTIQMLIRMAELFSHKELMRTPAQDRFCPYVLLRGLSPSELVELKTSLLNQGVAFNDGYLFKGADFSPRALAENPTKEQLWRLKFIPSDDQLAPTIAAATGSVVEVYDFYKTAPLDGMYMPKGKAAHAIQSNNSYLLQEVMQA